MKLGFILPIISLSSCVLWPSVSFFRNMCNVSQRTHALACAYMTGLQGTKWTKAEVSYCVITFVHADYMLVHNVEVVRLCHMLAG